MLKYLICVEHVYTTSRNRYTVSKRKKKHLIRRVHTDKQTNEKCQQNYAWK